MELSSTGTLSTVTHEGWPLGIGARFIVDEQGVPALCLDLPEDGDFSVGTRSSFHVQVLGFLNWLFFVVKKIGILEKS